MLGDSECRSYWTNIILQHAYNMPHICIEWIRRICAVGIPLTLLLCLIRSLSHLFFVHVIWHFL